MNLFSTTEQAICEGLIQDLVDTFATPTQFYIRSEELLISQDLNFNFTLQDQQPGTIINYIPVSGTFPARIKYLDNDELKLLLATQNRLEEGQTELRLLQSKPVVRLKVNNAAADFIGDVDSIKRVSFDGFLWVLLKAPRFHGLFTNRNYVTYYMERTT